MCYVFYRTQHNISYTRDLRQEQWNWTERLYPVLRIRRGYLKRVLCVPSLFWRKGGRYVHYTIPEYSLILLSVFLTSALWPFSRLSPSFIYNFAFFISTSFSTIHSSRLFIFRTTSFSRANFNFKFKFNLYVYLFSSFIFTFFISNVYFRFLIKFTSNLLINYLYTVVVFSSKENGMQSINYVEKPL